ncbi:DUF697 domain-containing protein [Thalassomonas sp. RHCl1]|uniref:YcjF family protein n=1 Tax=Thalassomonas sp. RHCl1 TaxID=2995320 RepID=UPI00248C06FF|nr:DUF697 domain-containing protein [Thalassomonas sp. RHCl1]
MSQQSQQAQQIVNGYTKGAAAVGLVPVPVADALLISGIQLKMLQQIAHLYGEKLADSKRKAVFGSILAALAPLTLRNQLVSWLKVVPVAGQVVGLLGMSTFSAASTWAIGRVFIQHYEAGGTLLDFDPDKMKNHYLEQFELGQKVAKSQTTHSADYVGVKP